MADRTEHSLVISKYHEILKRIQSVDKDPRFPTPASKLARKRVLQAELLARGGIEAYQAASREGEAHGQGFDCSKWVLGDLRTRLHGTSTASLRIVDVGAIVARFPASLQLLGEGHQGVMLDVRSIDLNPQDPGVERKDFFDLAEEAIERHVSWDVIVLSLVLNFVDSASRRGEMLCKAREIATASGGLLYLVLPLASVQNSRYCHEDQLRAVLQVAGWRVLSLSKSAKLISIVCEAAKPVQEQSIVDLSSSKRVLRTGSSRNNFAVFIGKALNQAKGRTDEGLDESRSRRPPSADGKSPAQRRRSKKTQNSKDAGGIAKSMTSNQRKRARRKKARQAGRVNGGSQ